MSETFFGENLRDVFKTFSKIREEQALDLYEKEWQDNRYQKKKPKLGVGYCRCDMNQIGFGEKCEICGRKDPHKRLKKY